MKEPQVILPVRLVHRLVSVFRRHPVRSRRRPGKSIPRFWPRIGLTKRQQFVLSTLVMTFGLLLTQLVGEEYRIAGAIVLAAISFVVIGITLRENLQYVEWHAVLTLPTMFTLSVGLFYFLLPVRWLTRIPVLSAYAIGLYALLLTVNIYSLSSLRTIALLRAAHTVGFLMTLVTYYFLVQTVVTIHLNAFFTSFLVTVVTYILSLQFLWSIELTRKLSSSVSYLSAVLSLIIGEFVWIFSFWPINTTLLALFCTVTLYSFGGIAQQFLADRLYRKTYIEFLLVFFAIMVIILLTARWRNFQW